MAGFRATDLANSAVSPITPPARVLRVSAFQVTRSMTSATMVDQIPGDSSIINIYAVGTGSNAGTTATISFGTSTTTTTNIVNAMSVTATGKTIATGSVWQTAYPNIVDVPVLKDIQIYATYAETGTASSVGGPWTVVVEFI